MALQFSTLNKKAVVNGKTDLLSNYLQIDYANVIIDNWILVDDQSAMLLDLVSFAMYGSENYADLLKKFNRIDNPLEISKGLILAIPNIQSLEANSRYVDLSAKDRRLQTTNQLSNSAIDQLIRTPGRKPTPTSNFTRSENGNYIF